VGPGIFLLVVGAILAFAVRTDASAVDLQVVGLILMIAGAGVILHARRGKRRERVVTRVDEPMDRRQPTHVVEETVTDRDVK
jgi:uncharacterized membrane protein HdeD (DUF308 family)